MDWAQILVIILDIVLAIFLTLGVALVVLLIQVTRQIKTVTSSAQRTADKIELAAAGISKMTSPLFLVSMVAKLLKSATKK